MIRRICVGLRVLVGCLALAGVAVLVFGVPRYSYFQSATLKPAEKTLSVDLGDGVKMELVLIRPGTFKMGSEESSDVKPVHEVTISKPFYLGKYEVTRQQWEKVMGSNPSNFKGPDLPVENVSWNDCLAFLGKLNEKTGGAEFSLPTEAQWEYACRAGGTGEYCYGDDEAGLAEYAWYSNNSENKTHPVGTKKANLFGLYDIHGNVWEWCEDWKGEYSAAPQTDPKGPAAGQFRVLRGGSWYDDASFCRSAIRSLGDVPDFRFGDIGVRVVRTP